MVGVEETSQDKGVLRKIRSRQRLVQTNKPTGRFHNEERRPLILRGAKESKSSHSEQVCQYPKTQMLKKKDRIPFPEL